MGRLNFAPNFDPKIFAPLEIFLAFLEVANFDAFPSGKQVV